MTFQVNLRNKIRELGYSHEELADRVWGHRGRRTTITEYLSGGISPNWETLVKLAKALDMEPKELMPSDKPASKFQHALNYVPKKNRVQHNVYVLKCGEFHKIGITNNVRRRISNMKSNNPYKIEIILQRPCFSNDRALRIERVAHRRLSKWAHTGEWFRIQSDEAAQVLEFVINRIIKFSGPIFSGEPHKPAKSSDQQPVKLVGKSANPRGLLYTSEFIEFCSEHGINPESQDARKKFKETF